MTLKTFDLKPMISLLKFWTVPLLLLLILIVGAWGQESPGAVLVDEFGELCSDDIRSRIDSFFATISDRPNSTGYVVGYPDQLLPGRHEKFVRLIRNHIAYRNFFTERVKFLRGANRDEMRIQFWLVPLGAPIPEPIPAYDKSAIVVPTLFDTSGIDSIEKGKVIFGERNESGEPCDFGLSLESFAYELKSNPKISAVLMATSNRRRSENFVRRVLSLTQQELTKAYGIHQSRIKITYAGTAKESEMQLWMVPPGTEPPRRFTTRLPN